MNEVSLKSAVIKLVENAVKDYILPAKHPDAVSGGSKVRVFDSYTPPKRSQGRDVDEYPACVVRLESSETTADKTTADITILAGCYSTEISGVNDVLNILTRVRDAICSLPFGTLDNKYQLERPLNISVAEANNYPYWYGELTTKWVFNAAQPKYGSEFGEFE